MNNAFNILSLYFCCFLLSTTGWSSAPDEKATKYRLTIKDIQQQESGTYTCASPRGLTNSIVIIVASNLYAPNSFSPFRMFGVVVNGTPRTTVFFHHRPLFDMERENESTFRILFFTLNACYTPERFEILAHSLVDIAWILHGFRHLTPFPKPQRFNVPFYCMLLFCHAQYDTR